MADHKLIVGLNRRRWSFVGNALVIVISLAGCNSGVDERSLTETALGVTVGDFPTNQGAAGFDELPGDSPMMAYTVEEQPVSGPPPQYSYETRPSVRAKAADGSEYEAYCGYDDPDEIASNTRLPSQTVRQFYGTHHGATYHPQSVFIGRREARLLNPVLVFPDVGSHTTAPHAFSIDNRGRFHLAVADVNIFQDNGLELYWAVGDPQVGRWTEAWLLERRGFTSWAHPRSVVYGDSVHLLWDWVDASHEEAKAQSGLFHVEWKPSGFTRKVRVAAGGIEAWDVAVDSESGLILTVFSLEDGLYGVTRSTNGTWSRPGLIRSDRSLSVSVEAREGNFVVRTGVENTREWAVRTTSIAARRPGGIGARYAFGRSSNRADSIR